MSAKSLCPMTTNIIPIPFAISTYSALPAEVAALGIGLLNSVESVSWIIEMSLVGISFIKIMKSIEVQPTNRQ
jgi:hypothetical protein